MITYGITWTLLLNNKISTILLADVLLDVVQYLINISGWHLRLEWRPTVCADSQHLTNFWPTYRNALANINMCITRLKIIVLDCSRIVWDSKLNYIFNYRKSENFGRENIFVDRLQRRKLNPRNIFSTYKWSKFLLSRGHNDKNKARRKFNRRNILPPKNSRSAVYIYIYYIYNRMWISRRPS